MGSRNTNEHQHRYDKGNPETSQCNEYRLEAVVVFNEPYHLHSQCSHTEGQDEPEAEGRVVTITSRKAQALLAYLALGAGRRYERARLADLMWGGLARPAGRRTMAI